MARFLVAGLINIETTLKVDGFPIEYTPVQYPFFGVNSTVSGVGYNLSKALTTLGDAVDLLSLIGDDDAEKLIRANLKRLYIADKYVQSTLKNTPQSVILYDAGGKRAIFTDLKDIQDQPYPLAIAEHVVNMCDMAVICNINFSRPMLEIAKQKNKLIATDVHAISQIDDPYNRDYMASATILFQSHERLPVSPETWAKWMYEAYGTPIIVIGLGADGALLAVHDDHFVERISTVYTRPVVNTIGAGDALFSAFIHEYAQTHDVYHSMRSAMVFASYKIGGIGGADGFLTGDELKSRVKQIYS
ncbi:MAG: carbohydrate kinase family protein [Phototrophicales bacterium]|nr:MAG: carbohydrate kinase family protein [Phototrophicales bacterium]